METLVASDRDDNLQGGKGAAKRSLLSAISRLGGWARALSERREASVVKDDYGTVISLGEQTSPFVIGTGFGRGFLAADKEADWLFAIPWSRISIPPRGAGPEKIFSVSLESDSDLLSAQTGKQISGIAIQFFVDRKVAKAMAMQFALDLKIFYPETKSVSSDSFGRVPVDVRSTSRRSMKSKISKR